MEYRTEKQFIGIMEDAENGNWSNAFENAEKYGFYAHDLIKQYILTADKYGWDMEDLIYIAEGAQKLRNHQTSKPNNMEKFVHVYAYGKDRSGADRIFIDKYFKNEGAAIKFLETVAKRVLSNTYIDQKSPEVYWNYEFCSFE